MTRTVPRSFALRNRAKSARKTEPSPAAAYDYDFRHSPHIEALDRADGQGITMVSVAKDWTEVFPRET